MINAKQGFRNEIKQVELRIPKLSMSKLGGLDPSLTSRWRQTTRNENRTLQKKNAKSLTADKFRLAFEKLNVYLFIATKVTQELKLRHCDRRIGKIHKCKVSKTSLFYQNYIEKHK